MNWLSFLGLFALSGCQVVLDIHPDVTICDPAALDHDSQNCGACGHSCGGGQCANSICQPVRLASASGAPTDIAIDATDVFWTSDDGSLGRVGKRGGDSRVVVSGVTGGLGRIAVDAHRVYARDAQDPKTIHGVNKDGSNIASVATDQPGDGGLASDGAALYWARTEGSNIGKLMRATFDAGGNPDVTTLIDNRSFPQEVAADGVSVFWNEAYADIEQLDIGATDPLELGCKNDINGIALDDANVYFSDQAGEIVRTRKGEADVNCVAPNMLVLATNPASPAIGIAVGGDRVVWTSTDAGEIWVSPKSGSCATPPCAHLVATGQAKPGRIAADAAAAYWVNEGDHTIMKVVF